MLRYMFPFVFCWYAVAQTASSPAGNWVSNLKYFENDDYDRLRLELNETKLTGKLGDDPFDGSFRNGRIEGTVKTGPKETIKLAGVLNGDRIEGTATLVEEKLDLKWEAYRERPKSTAPPQTHTFEPTQFEHYFSHAVQPVLHLNAGDTVKTWSVDAGGSDPKGFGVPLEAIRSPDPFMSMVLCLVTLW
jgi:amidase